MSPEVIRSDTSLSLIWEFVKLKWKTHTVIIK